MEDFHVVTVATQSKYYFPYLVQSCKRHGKELEVLGFGEKWGGFNQRNRLMCDYLKTLPANHIVCFVDGYDVLCVRDLKEMKDAFVKIQKETNCKIVVAKDGYDERFKFILKPFFAFLFKQCQNININAGSYIGYSGDLLEILQKIYEENPNDKYDDQKLLTSYCKKNTQQFYIDTNRQFFSVICKVWSNLDEMVDIKNMEVYINNQTPFFIHAVAGGYLDNIIIRLGYDYDHKIKYDIFKNMVVDKFIKSIFFKYLIIVLLIFITIYIYRSSLFNIAKHIYKRSVKPKRK